MMKFTLLATIGALVVGVVATDYGDDCKKCEWGNSNNYGGGHQCAPPGHYYDEGYPQIYEAKALNDKCDAKCYGDAGCGGYVATMNKRGNEWDCHCYYYKEFPSHPPRCDSYPSNIWGRYKDCDKTYNCFAKQPWIASTYCSCFQPCMPTTVTPVVTHTAVAYPKDCEHGYWPRDDGAAEPVLLAAVRAPEPTAFEVRAASPGGYTGSGECHAPECCDGRGTTDEVYKACKCLGVKPTYCHPVTCAPTTTTVTVTKECRKWG